MTKAIQSTFDTSLKSAKAMLTGIKARPGILNGRTVVSVKERLATVEVPIAKALTFLEQVQPVIAQRNDLYRLNKGLAKHLETFELPQAFLTLAYFEGTLYLVDGNTRKRRWLNQIDAPVPSHVTFSLLNVRSLEEAIRCYGCYDAKESKKTNRDELLSMFRTQGIDVEALQSPLLAGGKLVTVVAAMARAMSGASASPARKLAVVGMHKNALLRLDTRMLNEGVLKGSAVWAVLRLYHHLPEAFHKYVDLYIDELRKLETANESLAATSVQRAKNDAYRASIELGLQPRCDKAMPLMFPAFLEGFRAFSLQLIMAGLSDKKYQVYVKRTLCNVIAEDVQRVKNMQARNPAKQV